MGLITGVTFWFATFATGWPDYIMTGELVEFHTVSTGVISLGRAGKDEIVCACTLCQQWAAVTWKILSWRSTAAAWYTLNGALRNVMRYSNYTCGNQVLKEVWPLLQQPSIFHPTGVLQLWGLVDFEPPETLWWMGAPLKCSREERIPQHYWLFSSPSCAKSAWLCSECVGICPPNRYRAGPLVLNCLQCQGSAPSHCRKLETLSAGSVGHIDIGASELHCTSVYSEITKFRTAECSKVFAVQSVS